MPDINKREQITLRLPAELKDELQRKAQRRGMTAHDLMLFILWQAHRHTVLR